MTTGVISRHFPLATFRWQPSRSLRMRLVLWNLLILVVMLTLLGIIVYQLVVQRMLTELDARLRAQAAELETTARLLAPLDQPTPSDFYSQLLQNYNFDETSSDNPYVKILGAKDGSTLVRSANLGQEHLPLDRADFTAAQNGQTVFSTQTSTSGEQVRILTLPLLDSQHKLVAIAQLGQSLQPVEDVKNTLLTVLVLRCILAVVISYAVSYFLISRELRPLRQLVLAMHSLSAAKLETRLPKPAKPFSSEVQLITEAFNQMLSRLEASFKLQRAFVDDVSHELRTPLTAIRGQLEVALFRTDITLPLKQSVEHINAELGRLTRLVTNLLTHARAETGQLPELIDRYLQPVELDLLIVEVIRQAQFLNLKVKLKIAQLEAVHVPGDSDLLKQVLLNLVDNALAYTKAGGSVEIALTTSPISPSGKVPNSAAHWAVIKVCDTGPGIAPEELPFIFERHYRAISSKINRSKQGSGLGLHIARMLVEAHHGVITVESEFGKGTTFAVWLPVTPL